jgi:4-amino-4-deoxy-L-arabinose transferase-like glycosyltransferase
MLLYIRKLSRFESPSRLDWTVYIAVFIILQIPAIINFYYNDGTNNAYTLFAQSLLNGDLTLPKMDNYGDMAYFNGHYYLPYPPLPSLILAPFVALLGSQQVNTVAIATLLACVSLYTLYKIFLKLPLKTSYYSWLLIGFFFGTGYWLALFNSHHSYSFAHITSCLFQLLLINELLGKKRWLLIGTLVGCSFLTRQFTIIYILFALGYMFYLHKSESRKTVARDVCLLLLPTAFCISIYLVYNYLRFGNFLNTGYNYILYMGILKDRVDEYGVFSARYFLFNFYCFFLKGFNIEFKGSTYLNIKDMDLWGTSLLAASPFLIASAKAQWSKILKVSAWLTIIFILTGQLFYHNNGWQQVNTSRFSLDFLPLLVVLTALGVNHVPKWLFKGMIIYAVLLNLISFLIHFLYQ